MQIKSGYTHTHIRTQLVQKSFLGLLIALQMSRHMLFLWMCQTLSWMWLEQQLQLQMYCSPLLTLIISAKGLDCSNFICTLVRMWCNCPHGKRAGAQLWLGITIRLPGASQA